MKINSNTQMSNVYDLGMGYLEDRGWSIIAVSDTKLPLSAWAKYQTERVSTDEWAAWCELGAPGKYASILPFGVGIVTGALSGIVVVDCDNALAIKRCKDAGVWSHIRVKTMRGLHLYFKHPGGRVQNAQKVSSGIDIRGDGGMVVAPPTILGAEKSFFEYRWDVDDGFDWDDLQVLPDLAGLREKIENAGHLPDTSKDDDIDLTFITAQSEASQAGVLATLQAVVRESGKIKPGGRSQWLYRFIASEVGRGVWAGDLDESVSLMQDECFDTALPKEEVQKTILSVIKRDRTKNPGRYKASGEPVSRRQSNLNEVSAKLPVFGSFADFKDVAPIECLVHPLIWRPHFIHFHGAQGAGKSIILMNILISAAANKSWGPFETMKKVKSLYIDYDMSPRQLVKRVTDAARAIGLSDMPVDFKIGSSERYESGLRLNTSKGVDEFKRLLFQEEPDVVVIDTVRSAWPGLNENDASAWGQVNEFIKEIKTRGTTVILVHHSNKPTQELLGREAGSANQLTLVDLQAQIIQVGGMDLNNMTTDPLELESMQRAAKQRAFATGQVLDDHVLTRLHAKANEAGDIVRLPVIVEFGKNRDGISDCTRKALALTENKDTGKSSVVFDKGGLQLARELRDTHPLSSIASASGISISELRELL